MFETVLDYIARTNLFNFIIFAAVFALIFWKVDLIGGLEKSRQAIAEKIEDSEIKKADAEAGLQTIEDKASCLASTISDLIITSEENANLVGQKIISDANDTANNIKSGVLKLTENKAALLKNDIMRRVSLAVVDIAKSHILKELTGNNELHGRLIDESIEAINGEDI